MNSLIRTGGMRRGARTVGRVCLRPGSLPWVSALVVIAGMAWLAEPDGQRVWGQDDWDAGKQAANDPAAEVGMGGMLMEPEQFDQWVSGGKTREQIESTFELLLRAQVDSVARVCGISDAQREKLELAGRGDMKRYSRSVDRLKEKCRQVGQDQEKFNKLAQEVGPLQMKLQGGLFGDASLYQKIVTQTLEPEQLVRYEQQERERRKFRYEAVIELTMSNLENAIPLRAEQRQQLVKLLLDETEPPKKSGQFDYYVVLFLMNKLGDAKLKPIFDDGQWQTLKTVLTQVQGLEQSLELNGVLP